MSKKIFLVCCSSFVIGIAIGIYIGYYYRYWMRKAEDEHIEKYDPIEDSEYYKSIKDEVEHKVCQAMVDIHTKDSVLILYCNRLVCANETIPVSAIKSVSPEDACKTYLLYDGSCYKYWQLKKQILKEDYDIEWQSPNELNPDVEYD
ncbi:MAG: hypothetical protein J5621_00875 [Paludibacteraceae bacterium]|nr:hypothetical protein [Paludibacteraceae bacterium]